jgi:hypothetical protein
MPGRDAVCFDLNKTTGMNIPVEITVSFELLR